MSRLPADDLYSGTQSQRRRTSRNARVVNAPPPLLRLPRTMRRLQRQAPMLAIHGLSELSGRLRDLTGHELIDMARVMELMQFVYRQQQLARRGADYAVDDFGFDAEWTESFMPLFKILYRDYWRIETAGIEQVPAAGRALLVANHAGVLPWTGR